MAFKYNLEGKRVGKLTVIRKCEVDERPTQNHGNYWICKCDCGNECKVPTTYLTGNSNYTQYSCGCDRKKRAFQASTDLNIPDEYLEKYNKNQGGFEKFLLLHKAAVTASGNNAKYYNEHIDEYKDFIEFFWSDEQFNLVYNFWKEHEKADKTFYDWAKPSLDHIVPSSRGGENILSNFQFLTTFENLAKRDMTMEEWINFKNRTHTASDYFIENIIGREG